jgi:hypothetical protein
LLEKFNFAVREHEDRTKRVWASRIIATGAGAFASHSGIPGLGAGAKWTLGKLFARFPSFTPQVDPHRKHPGEALQMVSAGFAGASFHLP